MDQNLNEEDNKSSPKSCCRNISDSEKLHVLVLHGYRQNGKAFCEKTAAFRKMVHKWAKFTYITAPHKVIVVDDLDDVDEANSEAVPETGNY